MKRVVNILWASLLAFCLQLAQFWPWMKAGQRELIATTLGEYNQKMAAVPQRLWVGMVKMALVIWLGAALIYRYTPQQPFILVALAVLVAICPVPARN